MHRDPRSSEDRLHKLRLILRTMEEAVDDAKNRRTADTTTTSNEAAPRPVTPPAPTLGDSGPATGRDANAIPDGGPHGRGRDIPGPDSLPRAKARPKGFRGFGEGGSTLGRTG